MVYIISAFSILAIFITIMYLANKNKNKKLNNNKINTIVEQEEINFNHLEVIKIKKKLTLVCIKKQKVGKRLENRKEVLERISNMNKEEFILSGLPDMPYTEYELKHLLSTKGEKAYKDRLKFESSCIFSFNSDNSYNKKNYDLLTREFEYELIIGDNYGSNA